MTSAQLMLIAAHRAAMRMMLAACMETVNLSWWLSHDLATKQRCHAQWNALYATWIVAQDAAAEFAPHPATHEL